VKFVNEQKKFSKNENFAKKNKKITDRSNFYRLLPSLETSMQPNATSQPTVFPSLTATSAPSANHRSNHLNPSIANTYKTTNQPTFCIINH
jgi:hypothetical protein